MYDVLMLESYICEHGQNKFTLVKVRSVWSASSSDIYLVLQENAAKHRKKLNKYLTF